MGARKEFVKGKWSKKRKLQVPIYIDSNSDNEQSKNKCRVKLNMAKVMYEEKKIDAEI